MKFKICNKKENSYISGSVDVANRTLKSMNQTKSYDDPTALAIDGLKNMVKDLTKNPSKVFENTFNITGNNPRETADEISRIIQRQVERREASWA